MVEPLILALDRFAGTGGETAIDLATGRPVCLLRERLGDVQRQRVRVTRAAVVASVRHWSIAPLLDYGPDGPDTWVDAFSTVSISVLSGCGGPAADGATESIDAGRRLLAAAGVTIAACNVRVGCDDAGRCLLVPQAYAESSEVGVEPDVERELGKSSRPLLAAVLQRRDELDQLIDVLEDSRATGPRRLIVEAPAGAGVSTLLLTFAREARLRGFVPVSSRLCRDSVMSGSCARVRRSSLVGCLERRHIVVLDDRRSAPACAADREAEAAARFLAELGSADGRPHLVVNVVAEPSAGAHVRVGPLRSDLLRRCTVAVGVAPADFAHTVDDAALRSAGLPGPYVAALASGIGDGPNDSPYRASGRAAAQVRETPAAAAPLPPQGARVGHPGAGHVAAAIADRSRQLAARGRHAAAERLLRRCLGALRRRGLFGEAGAVALQLGRLLATRGRFRAACETFEQARVLHDSDGHVVGVIASLMHAGQARLHDAQFTAAEATLHTAIVAAEQAGIRRLADAARLLLAGCLLSKGDPVAALALADRVRTPDLRSPEPGAAVAEHPVESHGAGRADWDHPSPGLWIPPGLQAVPVEIAVRAALADRDVGKAARCLAAWRLRAASEPSGAIAVAALDVLVKGALGDAEGAARACDAGIRQARDAHLPVHAMELRMSYARALADAGDSSSALQQLRRVDRRGITRLPGLVSQDLVALRARLRGPDLSGRPSRSSEDHVDAAAVLRLLRLWQDADDDRIATAGVCDVLRDVLAASAATAFVIGADGPRAVANAGSRPCRPALVDRCGGGLDTVGPESTCAGIEAAARVRCGGTDVGGLAVRWPADAVLHAERVRWLLSAAASALAPALRVLADDHRVAAPAPGPIGELSGGSVVMGELRQHVARAAAAPYPVLVQGESGTGKELIARAVHAASPRKGRRFCAVNCAALSDDLFESELFGHTRGAFTGATSDRVGLFEEADAGTLFLDEVSELSARAQAKLLRVIQEGEIRRIGENHPRRVDARIVAATNRALHEDVRAGRFRHDLLFRLDVVRIEVPPLRDRPEDVPELVHRFWKEAMGRTGGHAILAPATVATLARYDWPGNVRELQNVLAALAVQAPRHGRVGPALLPGVIARAAPDGSPACTTLVMARRRFEERFVRATLARTGGRRSQTAAALGVSRQGLSKLMARLGIDETRPPDPCVS